jgi:hypothetical protein
MEAKRNRRVLSNRNEKPSAAQHQAAYLLMQALSLRV